MINTGFYSQEVKKKNRQKQGIFDKPYKFIRLKKILLHEHRNKKNKQINREEFDPGSGWTLAIGLTHASRGAAGLRTLATGARVSNTYATYP